MFTVSSDYDSLRDHFKQDHYLCQEGACIDERFTHAFRSEIDLQGKLRNLIRTYRNLNGIAFI